jgi:hypothetical protein
MNRYSPRMIEATQALRDIERRRLRALVDADGDVLDALHAPSFRLVHPSGGVWTKAEYVGGVRTGHIHYRRFEAVSDIDVMCDGTLAVLSYRSAIEIAVGGGEPEPLSCWHTDSYRRVGADGPWRVVGSQATEIRSV